mgnify:CR=1 FL=1|jgi:hypothetical protein
MSEETAVKEGQQPVEEQAQAAPDLTVNDLNALKQIIDVASSRGAFKPNEMSVVGTTYNKLELFLGAVSASQEANAQGEK